jgi:hypothetical protein
LTLLAQIALVALTAAGVAVCAALVADGPSRRQRRAAVSPPSRPEQLVALERLVITSGASTLHVHAYLRPLLVDIVSRRLAVRGHTLAGMSEPVARQVLGEALWEIVRPDRPFPEDRRAAGVSPRGLAAMLATVERL